MPLFHIVGRGIKSNRKRRVTVRAIDEDTALTMVEAQGVIIEQMARLAPEPASPGLVALVESLGGGLSEQPSHEEAVATALMLLARKKLKAKIQMGETLLGDPWFAHIEPYKLHESKQGMRLRCWVDPLSNDEILTADQIPGWHLYLLEDIISIEVLPDTFAPRSYKD